jgi:hypothetical protein
MRGEELFGRAFVVAEKAATRAVWLASRHLSPRTQVDDLHRRSPASSDAWGEYVRAVRGPACVEPQWGYVITAQGELFEDSMCPNFPPHRPLWRLGTASPASFLAERRRRSTAGAASATRRARQVPVAASLRHFWDWNYYHFYFDVLGKLSLLRDAGVSESIPLVLGSYAGRFPWAREILSRGELARRTWIIPDDDEYVWADEMIFCRTQQDYKYKMDFVLDSMGVAADAPRRDDRVFLDRADAKFRHILNIDELRPVFDEYGFRYVPSLSGFTVADQIALFANTKHFVAVHGAGITNVVFRRDAPMSVLELHAANYISTDFKRMAKEYGHHYETLAGEPDGDSPIHANFVIPPARLREVLGRVVATGG